ncbi:MAG: dienelactone hydrolase family protein [Alphaproteobacteria bacterium]|nr:dienelactone hydrolase family protein [Alphaproteobacteria bacterium]
MCGIGCDPRDLAGGLLEIDTLILIGGADDWTPAERCARWRDSVRTNGHVLQKKTYSGARHGFDAPRPPDLFAGHYVGRTQRRWRTPWSRPAGSSTTG